MPVWLQEGLARFEQTRWRRPPEVRLSATEQALLAAALKKGRLITFDEMHPSMAKLPSQEAAALAYAEVYTLVGWMHGKVGYKGIRDALVAQRTARARGARSPRRSSMSWAAVEQGVARAPQARSPRDGKARAPASRSSSTRAASTPRTSGSSRSSARARKYARLGGMLRARGMLDAAAVEYEKALAVGGPSRSSPASSRARSSSSAGTTARSSSRRRWSPPTITTRSRP